MDQSENIERNEISQVLQCLTLYMPPYVCLSVLFVANITANYCRIYYPILNWQLQHCTCKELRANFAEKRRNFGASIVLVSARLRELGDGAKRKFAGLWYENLHHKNEISFWLNEILFYWNYIWFCRSDISSACNEISSLEKILSGPEKNNYHLNVKVSAIIIWF